MSKDCECKNAEFDWPCDGGWSGYCGACGHDDDCHEPGLRLVMDSIFEGQSIETLELVCRALSALDDRKGRYDDRDIRTAVQAELWNKTRERE